MTGIRTRTEVSMECTEVRFRRYNPTGIGTQVEDSSGIILRYFSTVFDEFEMSEEAHSLAVRDVILLVHYGVRSVIG